MQSNIKKQLRIYFISSSEIGLDRIEEALKSGVTMFQLREKGDHILSGETLTAFALNLKNLTEKYNVPLIINDDTELAETVNADGIHLGQDDLKPSELSSFFNEKIVGLSVADQNELSVSDLSRVDYIGTGPVFETLSKKDAGKAIGTKGLKAMREAVGELPIVAIGGITHQNFKECLKNGADGISVISAISHADDIKTAVRSFM